jgi:hypothetical protein
MVEMGALIRSAKLQLSAKPRRIESIDQSNRATLWGRILSFY